MTLIKCSCCMNIQAASAGSLCQRMECSIMDQRSRLTDHLRLAPSTSSPVPALTIFQLSRVWCRPDFMAHLLDLQCPPAECSWDTQDPMEFYITGQGWFQHAFNHTIPISGLCSHVGMHVAQCQSLHSAGHILHRAILSSAPPVLSSGVFAWERPFCASVNRPAPNS